MVERRAGLLWSGFGVAAVVSSLTVMARPVWDRMSDLHIYYGAVRTVHSGQPLYGYVAENGGPFTYPPFAALLMWPIGWVPEAVLRVVWLVLVCAAIIAAAAAASTAIRWARHHRQVTVAALACALLLSAPVQSNLRFGQVSLFIVLLALVDGAGLTPSRYRGILVGVAAAVKLTPLLFVVFFVGSRRFGDAGRAVAAFAACAVVGVLALPADSWAYWSGTMLETSRIGDLASLGNQSVHGMLLRVGVDRSTLPVLWAVLVAGICGTALLRARRLQLDGQRVRAAVLVGCATVVASPVSWTHHQVWTVLAATLLVAAGGALRRVAGAILLTVMAASLSVLLADVSTFTGWQFVLENARAVGVAAVCLAGCGGLAAVAVATGRRSRPGRMWWRVGTAAAAGLAGLALVPLPAGADPTFKAYTSEHVHNQRYFFFCDSRTACATLAAAAPISFAVLREETKVRVNGVVGEAVMRLEYRSAPGGSPRTIPLVEIYPGQRGFSFRSANLAHGELVAYGSRGRILASFTEELDP